MPSTSAAENTCSSVERMAASTGPNWPGAGSANGSSSVITRGPCGAQVVRTLHRVPNLSGAQRGQLVHDRVGPHVAQGGKQVLAIHHVGHHGLGAGTAQPLRVGLAAGDAHDLVAGG